MGSILSMFYASPADIIVTVKTGDIAGAGTDATVKIVLIDEKEVRSQEYVLDNTFRNDFEQGREDTFNFNDTNASNLGPLQAVEFWRDSSGVFSDWFIEYINVKVPGQHQAESYDFPVFRWIKGNCKYTIDLYDTTLPQNDRHEDRRKLGIKEKQEAYQLCVKQPGIPAQIKDMPSDEKFSWDYKWNIMKRKGKLIAASKIKMFTSGEWESLGSLRNLYTKEHLIEPMGAKRWTQDGYFGLQRVSSCSHGLIRLCTSIPNKFGVTEEMLEPLLEGMTINEAINQKRLFVVDLDILKDLPCADPKLTVCAPIALFLENENKQLVPIAIQLFQDKAADNPVFLPTDNPWTWLLVKMWYNNADASYHQSLTHLAFTHLLMEGVSVITHRNLSQSHPIFKLLAPHFLFLIAINSRGLELLISEGGWVDKTMTIGIKGMFEVIRRGIKRWRMNVNGIIPEDLRERGLLDESVLDYFPYRADALLLHEAIKTYVTEMVELYYPTTDLLEEDWEIQNWAKEMVTPREQGGVGLLGVPGDGHFSQPDQLITVLTCIISTCSVAHAASNFPQYDEYAFPPNYPGLLRGKAPTDKSAKTEADILATIPNKVITLDTMVVTKILSDKGTKSLGDFEVNYIFDPEAKQIVNRFRKTIQDIAKIVQERNKTRNPPYVWLEPDHVPNSISI